MAIRRVPDEDLDEATDGWPGEHLFLFRWEDERGDNWNVTVGTMKSLRGGLEADVRRTVRGRHNHWAASR